MSSSERGSLAVARNRLRHLRDNFISSNLATIYCIIIIFTVREIAVLPLIARCYNKKMLLFKYINLTTNPFTPLNTYYGLHLQKCQTLAIV